ncbi:RDD family protein [Cellvibrio zantedeschiae]|uniref:RDD family protein n=1 Tax=Cellvibrio zantedeschiae TaxID=1237077 RepID=A0ABQ3AYY1_9GAMM|nr:RDD family protein [Cellvibrio zantedeschiae]GGY71624.1 RDD family protein [Cellvibrio zantedeschiae]
MKKNVTPVTEFAAPGLPRIFAAMVYDSLLLAAISIAYGALVVGIDVAIFGQPEAGQRIHWSLFAKVFITLGWLLVITFFYVYFWQKFGQTLGMKTWRMQLVDANTNQIVSYSQALKRSAFAWLSLLLLGMGYWLSLVHPQGRLLHDLLSGTKLILLKKK